MTKVLVFLLMTFSCVTPKHVVSQTKKEAFDWMKDNLIKAIDLYMEDYSGLHFKSVSACEFSIGYKDKRGNNSIENYSTFDFTINQQYGTIKYDGNLQGALRTKNGRLEDYFICPWKVRENYIHTLQTYVKKLNSFCEEGKEIFWKIGTIPGAINWLEQKIKKFGYTRNAENINPKIVSIDECNMVISYTHQKIVNDGWTDPEILGETIETIPLSMERLSDMDNNFQSDKAKVTVKYLHNGKIMENRSSILQIVNGEPNLYVNILTNMEFLTDVCKAGGVFSYVLKTMKEDELAVEKAAKPIPHKSFHSNGKTEQEGQYKNNKPDGVWKFYHYNGKLNHTGKYVNGFREGEWVSYYDTGNLHEIGNYTNDKKNGTWKTYSDVTKKIIAEVSYKNDKRVGSWKRLDIHTGAVSEIGNYNNNGDKNGTWKKYHSNGKLKEEVYYENGIKMGKTIGYHFNGKLFYEGAYNSKGKSTGEWRYYSENGKLTNITKYEDGIIIEQKKL